jgi:sugar (pentulose or hexulose) kinase
VFSDFLHHPLQEYAALFPSQVVAPSAPVATITAAAASRTGLPPSCLVCGGTTDSIAAFVAAGVSQVGEAVTSLGSTMAVKLLSQARVDDAAYGVYSHRLGGWYSYWQDGRSSGQLYTRKFICGNN